MTNADFTTIIDQIEPRLFSGLPEEQSENAFYRTVSAECLTLHGYGEPLLDPHIVKRVQTCTDGGIPTYFSCKPIKIDEQMLSELHTAGLTVLKFAWDYMPTDFNWAKMIANWKGSMKIAISIVAKDGCAYPGFAEFWREKGIYAYVKSQDNRWFYDKGAPENKSHYMKSHCQFPWTSMTVLSNGDVVPCTQDYDGEMKMGNIREQSLKDIWNSDEYNKLRQAHEDYSRDLGGYKCYDRCDLPIKGAGK